MGIETSPECETAQKEQAEVAQAERLQLEEDMLEIYELQDFADAQLFMTDDDGVVTQSGTVRAALVDCKFFHDLEPSIVRQIIFQQLAQP